MLWKHRIAGLALAVAVLGSPIVQPIGALAQARSASTATLQAQITKTYKWARVYLTPRSLDGKEFSLTLIVITRTVNLAEGIGANLLNMYITQLPGQRIYYMTAYTVAGNGAPEWQYIYVPSTRQLLRQHFVSARSLQRTTWYITLKQIAQAAKAGHWPKST